MSGSAYQERLEARKADFKKGIDVDEARRRRDDDQLSIRKSKREDKLAKRRQQVPDQTPSGPGGAVASPAQPVHTSATTQEMMVKFHSNTFADVLEATTHFRKILSIEKNPPIQTIIDSGIVPRLLQYCTAIDYPKLQYEAAWALTNIASGTSAQTKVVIDVGAVPVFIKLLESPDESVREQSIWALGNIAGDSPAHRDMVLKCGVMPSLVKNIQHASKLSMLRNATWTLSNLTRGKPVPEFELVAPALPALSMLVTGSDEEVLTDACWAVSYMSDGNEKRVEALVQTPGMVKRMIELMAHSNVSIQTPALRTVGNIATGTDTQTDAVVQLGAVPALAAMLRSGRKAIRKEAMWTLSNITAGTKAQIEAVKAAGAVPDMVRLLAEGEWDIRKEAAWALSNYCSGGSREHIQYLVNCKGIKPLCDLLGCSDNKMLVVALDAINAILKSGKSNKSNTNAYADLVEDCEGIDKIEELQQHADNKVYAKAVDIIEKYFSAEEEENVQGGLAPNMQGGVFQFDTSAFGSAPAFGAAPAAGGFTFGSPMPAGGGFGQPMQQQPQQAFMF